MKVSKQKVAEHREQIIAVAAKRFREKGFGGISVADLMQEAGFTHGGFYGHFSSKEELMELASQRALRETAKMWEKVIEEAPARPLEALVKYYLSSRHLSHAETGCLFAALGSELARQPRSMKEAMREEQLSILGVISRVVPGRTKAARRKQAMIVLAGLIGAMVLARSLPDSALSEEVLKTVAASVTRCIHADAYSKTP